MRAVRGTTGRMEWWNNGMMGLEMATQYSNIPSFQYSIFLDFFP
jgi:hypothetical protein